MADAIRILIVDDEPSIVGMLELATRRAGWEPTTALNVETATEQIERGSFDIYLFDKNLPDGDGIDLAARVRERTETAICVIITAYPSVESARETLRLGISAYLEKPFEDLDQVIEILRRLHERARLRTSTSAEARTADRPLSVLVASPDEPARQWLDGRFRSLGDDIVVLDSGRDVIERVRALGPDLVILDAALTDPDVPSLTEGIDARAVVVLSRASPATRDLLDYISLEVKAVLERPLSDQGFADEMDGLLWRLRNHRQ